jgi:ABC-2 type transport system permease protein
VDKSLNAAIKIYFDMIKVYIATRMQYRANFVLVFFADVLFQVLRVLLVFIVLSRFNNLNGWGFYEILFMFGLWMMVQALASIFFRQAWDFEQLIISGKFDRYLVKPVNPLLQFFASRIEIGSIFEFIFGLIVFVIACQKNLIIWDVFKVLFLIITLISGLVIHIAISLIVIIPSFWIKKTTAFLDSVYIFNYEFVQYPITIYPKPIQIILSFIIPFAFVSYYPSTFFLSNKMNELPFTDICYFVVFIAIISFIFAYRFWCYGINKYTSSGS